MKTSNQSEFSPAPWHIRTANAKRNFVDAANNMPVCEWWLHIDDARLIAAAPELYVCLEEAVCEMCHVLPDGGWDGPCPHYDTETHDCDNEDGKCFVQKWVKALRKARGEE